MTVIREPLTASQNIGNSIRPSNTYSGLNGAGSMFPTTGVSQGYTPVEALLNEQGRVLFNQWVNDSGRAMQADELARQGALTQFQQDRGITESAISGAQMAGLQSELGTQRANVVSTAAMNVYGQLQQQLAARESEERQIAEARALAEAQHRWNQEFLNLQSEQERSTLQYQAGLAQQAAEQELLLFQRARAMFPELFGSGGGGASISDMMGGGSGGGTATMDNPLPAFMSQPQDGVDAAGNRWAYGRIVESAGARAAAAAAPTPVNFQQLIAQGGGYSTPQNSAVYGGATSPAAQVGRTVRPTVIPNMNSIGGTYYTPGQAPVVNRTPTTQTTRSAPGYYSTGGQALSGGKYIGG